MKLIHLTDPHVGAAGETVVGLDPIARLAPCVEDILAHHGDADLCVITGNLVHRQEATGYARLRDALAGLPMPVRAVLGNHDSRGAAFDALDWLSADANGFAQASLDTTAGTCLFLDTLDDSRRDRGEYCEHRHAWLDTELRRAGEGPVYLFMHHPPFDVGIPALDRVGLTGQDRFAATLAPYDNVRHVFFGHAHRPMYGTWRGIGFSTLLATNHQFGLSLDIAVEQPRIDEGPAYAVVLIDADSVVVHYCGHFDAPYLEPGRGSIV